MRFASNYEPQTDNQLNWPKRKTNCALLGNASRMTLLYENFVSCLLNCRINLLMSVRIHPVDGEHESLG